MTSTLPSKRAYILVEKLKQYVRFSSQRIFTTPERALENAYRSALKIKEIEQETELVNDSKFLSSVLRADLDKNLTIVRMRLAEFQVSSFMLGNLNRKNVSKLKFIEEIITKYTDITESSPSLLALPESNLPTIANTENFTDKTGAFPRSIGRTINKIKTDFNPQAESQYVNNFRNSRIKTRMAVQLLMSLVIVPVLAQNLSKQFLIFPIVERVRDANQSQMFLHEEMKEEAFHELNSFEEGLKFEKLIHNAPQLSTEVIESKVQHKAQEIAKDYRQKSSSAISNVFADFVGIFAFAMVMLFSKKRVIALKSFMNDIVYGLSDSAKAFILILLTDIFVGFHSPHGWEVILEGISNHLGIAANHSVVFLFIATFPVVLDSIFKYWIFRYMSRMSPSTVATFKNMNE
ncbi:MAG: proton extrusion protein PcxA [Richelia sp. RM2_1_2]|nr:proton extrusion protein PcxA [Richelia sp. SM2_1_7]NJN08371.1 proton extrusion protein PcxA [Richelia sp. RM1_1_1]NJO26914.1 proton extrusion protein PcxA [Richelia sp. SL_2_1]NJO62147.1 proton extrusion protein PcxA [Richelia sp. RM2_1_2]